MKKTVLFLLLLLFAGSLAGYGMRKSKKKGGDTIGSRIAHIDMDRGSCFGKCPSYKIQLYASGRAVYTGRTFAPVTGVYEKNIGADKMKQLFKEFQQDRVDTCKEEYAYIPDLPSLTYTIVYQDKGVKTIKNANRGPDFLKILGNEIDQMIQVDDSWKKMPDKVTP